MKIHEPAMTFSEGGREEWERYVEANKGYGAAIMRFASEWATRMEARERLKSAVTAEQVQCAIDAIAQEESSAAADDEGITGFMYGAAVATLAKCWVYGESLRIWHNKDVQIGDEGDRANENGTVLNPAVLNIATK